MLELWECDPGDEIFEHVELFTGKRRFFNATKLTTYAIAHGEELEVPIDDDIKHIVKDRGVEEWKVARLHGVWLEMPVTAVHMADGSTLTVDGHHRLTRWIREGRKTFYMNRVRLGEWEQFLVNAPEWFGTL